MSGPSRIISLKVKVQTTDVCDVTEEASGREKRKSCRERTGKAVVETEWWEAGTLVGQGGGEQRGGHGKKGATCAECFKEEKEGDV